MLLPGKVSPNFARGQSTFVRSCAKPVDIAGRNRLSIRTGVGEGLPEGCAGGNLTASAEADLEEAHPLMRQQSMLRHALVPAAIFAVFAAPAAAQAAPVDNGSQAASPVKLRALTAPPREALAGDSFRVTASVRNTTDRTIRPRLTITLRKARSASGRTLATRRLARIKPGKTLKQRMRVRVPRTTATGRYYIAACVRLNGRRSCRVAGRRVNVLRATTAPGAAAGPAGTGPGHPARALQRARVHRVRRRPARRHGRRRRRPARARHRQPLPRDRRLELDRPLHAQPARRLPRGHLPEHVRRRPQRRRADGVRGLLPRRRRLPRRAPRDRHGARLAVHDRAARDARDRRGLRGRAGDDRGPRPRPRRHQDAARHLEPHRLVLRLRRERARRVARAGHGRRGDLRGRSDGLRPPGLVVQGRRRRPFLLHRRRRHGRGVRDRRLPRAPDGRDRLDRRTVRPGLQRLRRHRAGELRADEAERAAEPQRADRLRPAP